MKSSPILFSILLSCFATGASLVHAQPPQEEVVDPETPGDAETPEAEAAPEVPDEEMSERQRASTRFRRGVELYNNGDYRAALIEFQRAFEIAPNYRVLYNLGQASFQLHDYVEAKTFFERYLAEGGAEISEDRRTEVALELTTLDQYIATVDVSVNIDGAEIIVDGQVVGESPLDEPLMVSAGRHEVTTSREGHAPVTRVIDVAGGETASLEIELLSLAETSTKLSTGFWVSAIAVGAVAIATITVGVLALQANSRLEDELNTFPNDPESIAAARSEVQNLTLATDILLATVGVGLITTVLIGIFGRTSTEDEDAPAPDAVAIVPTANGVAITF